VGSKLDEKPGSGFSGNQQLATGRNPSIDAVREELGTGSKSTIHRYLKEIEEEEGGATGTRVAVSEAIQDLVCRLAARVNEEAEERVTAMQARHAEQLALEHFRESTKEQRDQDQRKHEQQVQYLQAELRTVNETLATKQQEAVHTLQENARLLGDLSRAQGDLHQAQEEVRRPAAAQG
jgi:SOS-response transcriptional repressor LexA